MPRARRSASPVRRPVPERRAASPPPRQSAYPPAAAPPQQMAPHAPSKGPGLMAQMASTAGGVAIGSVVGHGVSNALFGGGGGGSSSEAAPPASYQQPPPPQQQYAQQPQQSQPQVCGWELQQFLTCAQNQQDISLCEGFNDALKQCKRNNGMMA